VISASQKFSLSGYIPATNSEEYTGECLFYAGPTAELIGTVEAALVNATTIHCTLPVLELANGDSVLVAAHTYPLSATSPDSPACYSNQHAQVSFFFFLGRLVYTSMNNVPISMRQASLELTVPSFTKAVCSYFGVLHVAPSLIGVLRN
jgi:hypothetical protein